MTRALFFRFIDIPFGEMPTRSFKGIEYKPIEHGDESQRKSIVVSIWLIVFLNIGITKAVGVLLPSLQDQFETYTRTIGAIVSLLAVSGTVLGR